MSVTIGQIIHEMDTIAPPCLAEAWDNVGLHVGHQGWPVRRVWIALDPSDRVVIEAARCNVDLVIAHHPLFYKPLSSLDPQTFPGRTVAFALEKHIGIFCAHTNLDNVSGGLNDMLAERLDLRDRHPLKRGERRCCVHEPAGGEPGEGLGRIGSLREEMTLLELAERTKEMFDLRVIRMAGAPGLVVRRVALCTGSGRGLLGEFLGSDAQAYVTGDLGYHDGRAAEDAGKGVIDIGHFASEHLVTTCLAERLQQAVDDCGYDVRVEAFTAERDCFRHV